MWEVPGWRSWTGTVVFRAGLGCTVSRLDIKDVDNSVIYDFENLGCLQIWMFSTGLRPGAPAVAASFRQVQITEGSKNDRIIFTMDNLLRLI